MKEGRADIPKTTSLKLANMAWLSAVFIVIIHVMSLGKTGTAGGYWFRLVTDEGMCPAAVPFFFLTSGWLLGRHVDEENWWRRELGKRVRTILVPFAILSVIGFFGSNGMVVISRLMNGRGLEGVFTVPGVLADFGLNPFDFPGHNVLWFLRALMLFVFASPVLVALIRRVGLAVPAFFFIVLTVSSAFLYAGENTPLKLLFKSTLNPTGMAFFTIGLYLRMKGRALYPADWRQSLGLFVGWLALWLLKLWAMRQDGVWFHVALSLNRPMALCLIPALLGFMPAVKCPWAWTSFAVFVLHTYLTGLLHAANSLPEYFGLEHYLGVTFLVTALSMGVGWLLVTYLPALAELVFGGRVQKSPSPRA